MGVHRLLKIFTFCVILASCPALAQSYFCKHVDIRDGLSQPSVTGIISDSQGAVWIGTKFGLNKYRSGHITVFGAQENQSGLEGSFIHSLFLDADNRLWAATETGLFVRDPDRDHFTCIERGTVVRSAAKTPGGLVFGGTGGLHLYGPGGDFVRNFISIDNAFIVRILPVDEDRCLIVDRGLGLMEISLSKRSVRRISVPSLEYAIIMDACIYDGSLYLSVYNKGLCCVDLESRTVTRVYNTSNSSLTFDIVLSIMENEGKLWIGTDGGGICVLERGEISVLADVSGAGGELEDAKSFTSLYTDSRGAIWAGTVRNGAFSLKTTDIRVYTTRSPGRRVNLSNNVVISLWKASDGILWVGTDGGGVNRYNPATGEIDSFPGQDGLKIHSLTEMDSRTLLLSVYSQGLETFDKASGRRRPFLIENAEVNQQECGSGGSPKLYRTSGGDILILAIRTFLYSPSKGTFRRLNVGREFLDVSELTLFAEDSRGFLYAFSHNGLFRIDLAHLAIDRILESVPGETLSSAALSPDGRIWVGTSCGLKYLNPGDKTLTDFPSRQFTRVTQLKSWRDSRLWIAADNMLFSKDRSSMVEILDESDGFPANEILTETISNTEADEAIYLGGTDGLVVIQDRSASRGAARQEMLELYDVTSSGKRLECGTGDKVRVPWNYGTLQVQVNLRGIDPFQKVLYRFEVTGGAQDFVTQTYQDVLPLSGLKEGTYVINASYVMRDGSWSDPVKLLSIDVTPPWFRSWWFFILVLTLVTILVTYAVYRYNERTQQNLAHTLSRWVETSVEADESPRKSALGEEERDLLGRLNSYVEEHMSDNTLNVAEIAREAAMSRASLYSKVKAITGMGVAQYVEDLRIRRACRLLKETRKSVAEISEEVGFSTPNYFSMRFKQTVGISPLTFRKNAQDSV